jgi:hypothetical protein
VIVSVLPKIKLQKKTHKKGFWTKRENRRQFLIDLAKSKGLDPFAASTWRTITTADIGAAQVCCYY